MRLTALQVYSDNGKREVQTLRTAYLDITQKLSQMKQVLSRRYTACYAPASCESISSRCLLLSKLELLRCKLITHAVASEVS